MQGPGSLDVLLVGLRPFASDRIRSSRSETIEEALAAARPDLHDAALIDANAFAPEGGPAFDAIARRVRAGGVVAIVATEARAGLAGTALRALAALDPKRRPRPLEELCAGLLSAGASRVGIARARGGVAIVFGIVAQASGA